MIYFSGGNLWVEVPISSKIGEPGCQFLLIKIGAECLLKWRKVVHLMKYESHLVGVR